MPERQISMHAELIGATRSGKKGVTRRPSGLETVNHYPDEWTSVQMLPELGHKGCAVARFASAHDKKVVLQTCPYGAPGDVLWIKEPHLIEDAYPSAPPHSPRFGKKRAVYWLDKTPALRKSLRWRDAHTLAREHCRTFAEILEISVQRLEDMGEVGAIDEGFLTVSDEWVFKTFPAYAIAYEKWAAQSVGNSALQPPLGPSPKERFRAFMRQCYKPEFIDSNPWLWVIKFQLLTNYQS